MKQKPINTLRLISYLFFLDICFFAETTAQVEFTSSNLPIIIIDTHGQSIVDESRIVADMGIIYNEPDQRNNLADTHNNYSGKIAIELRGSSSMSYPKKQYRLETQDLQGENLNVALMGMTEENDWILNGPYHDITMMRNVLVYNISNDLGHYASRTQYCELVLNNEYQGLYILLEKVKRDGDRVDISKLEPDETEGDDLTGGYIIKLDKLDGENVDGWTSTNGIYYQYHYPKPDEIVGEQKQYIQAYIANFESIMLSNNWNDEELGYPSLIDINSFVDYVLINEFSKNIDAYRLSTYLYKDKDSDNPKLFAGPVWDYNLSFGDAWYGSDVNVFQGWEIDHNIRLPYDSPKIPFWWIKIAKDKQFTESTAERWFALRSGVFDKDSLSRRIDSLHSYIMEAQNRNSERWPDMGNYNNFIVEIGRLKSWINNRIDWIDANINSLYPSVIAIDHIFPQNYTLNQNYPNPFNHTTTITFSLPSKALVTLKIFDLVGNKVEDVVQSEFQQGAHSINISMSRHSAGIYLYRLSAGNFSSVRKMIYLK